MNRAIKPIIMKKSVLEKIREHNDIKHKEKVEKTTSNNRQSTNMVFKK